MNKIYLVILAATLFYSCGNTDKPTMEEDAVHAEERGPLLVEEILSANPAIKIGPMPSRIVQQKVICTGKIEIPPTELISVHSRSEGFITGMTYLPGDYVKRGALLFTITNTKLVEKQRILLETKAELTMANKDYDRKKRLQSEKVTTEKALDESTARKELLTATYEGLKNELQLLGIDVDALQSEQKFQSTLYIYASDAGYVHEVLVNKGQMIQPSDNLMQIANDDHVHLELQVLSKYVPLLAIGQKALFTLPNSAKEFGAEIVKLNPMLNDETGTLNVHCHIDEEHDIQIIAGMFVNAEIEVVANDVSGLPLEAVVKEGMDYYAYCVEGEFLKKHLLQNVVVSGDFITFDTISSEQMVIAGAYYVE